VSARRQVRVAPSFFDRLDELLPAERSPTGVPSTADFLLHEIPPLIDLLGPVSMMSSSNSCLVWPA
jgi:hypothetical protein